MRLQENIATWKKLEEISQKLKEAKVVKKKKNNNKYVCNKILVNIDKQEIKVLTVVKLQ